MLHLPVTADSWRSRWHSIALPSAGGDGGTQPTQRSAGKALAQRSMPMLSPVPMACGATNELFSIHLDLMAAGFIPDPYLGMNEAKVQWVHDGDWVYETSFEHPHLKEGQICELVFEGLDTFVTVNLNGQTVLEYGLSS